MTMQQHFSLPIWQYDIDMDFSPVIENCLQLERSNFKNRNASNIGGWQSDDINHLSQIDPSDTISTKLDEIISSISSQIDPNFKMKIASCWININRKKDFNVPHYHPLSTLSACLYLQVPENSGNIIFESESMLYHYPLRTSNKRLFEMRATYKPKVGRIVIFPAFLKHFVEPNMSEEPRISVAFNFLQFK